MMETVNLVGACSTMTLYYLASLAQCGRVIGHGCVLGLHQAYIIIANTISIHRSKHVPYDTLDTPRGRPCVTGCLLLFVQCLPFVDSDVLGALVPKMVEILKRGVGLNTRVAAAQLVVSLVQHCLMDLTPFAGT